jgi:hypothetical protein
MTHMIASNLLGYKENFSIDGRALSASEKKE